MCMVVERGSVSVHKAKTPRHPSRSRRRRRAEAATRGLADSEMSYRPRSITRRWSWGVKRLKDIENNVEADAINVGKYVKELSKACWDMFRASGAIFEQDHLRFIRMFIAAGTGGNGGGHGLNKGIVEHKASTTCGASVATSRCSDSGTTGSSLLLVNTTKFTGRLSNIWSRRPTSARTWTKSWRS